MRLMKDVPKEKLRGGFYTPPTIADFILRWANSSHEEVDILEPSCGDGMFLKRIRNCGIEYRSLTAIEIVDEEARKARDLDLPRSRVYAQDFLEYCVSTPDRFDLIVGNPPYIRYQFLDKNQQELAERIFEMHGLKYSRLSNAWVSFVVGSALLLKEEGKMGFVVPAEILQVSFARQLRSFLTHYFNKISIVSFRHLVFQDIQQEVVLLLVEKNGTDSHLIEHLEVDNASGLEHLDVTELRAPRKRLDFNSNKWTFYFLDQEEIDFIENLLSQERLLPLRSYAEVQVGMTTGSNAFFTVPLSVVKEYHLQEYTRPMVGRSVQVPSVIFSAEDWSANVVSGARAHFLDFPSLTRLRKNRRAMEYIKSGEESGIHKLYKCRIRKEWQIQPSAWVSDALFIRRNNIFPKLILNEARAYTTDTMHRVTPREDINLKALVASYYNSLSFAFAEICGRSHGGGVLELMPNEAENILIPYDERNADLLSAIDLMMRRGRSIEEILQQTNQVILCERAGFEESDIATANAVWKKLLTRRLNRNRLQ